MFNRLIALVAVLCATSHAFGDELKVAVAANMASPMTQIAERFERERKQRISVVVGSTGQFATQIRQGAPFDLLIAADDETAIGLERDGFAVAGTRRHYATGRLALWSREPGRVDANGAVLLTLARGGSERLAIANPRLAPYGAAALETLDRLGLRAALQDRLVQGESIGQTYQFVASGNAPLGFVALSQIMVEGKITRGSAWIVPERLYTPLRQEAVQLSNGRDKPAARALLDFLGSESARKILRDYGYL